MTVEFGADAIRAAFSQPDNDGTFRGAFAEYLAELSRQRPAVIFAFPPKAAGTFLRSAAIGAVDGQLMRIVHAQGGRDAQPYLPLFITYFSGNMGAKPLVAHVHMQALHANRRFLEALNLKPIAMLRSIPDMLASYWDMLETDQTALEDGLNCNFPPGFRSLDAGRKADLLVDILAPWYTGYYASWIDYAHESPDRVSILTYEEFLNRPAAALERALAHAGVPRSRDICQAAIEDAWNEKEQWRFNRGEPGRGRAVFSAAHIAQIRRLLSHYPVLESVADQLAA